MNTPVVVKIDNWFVADANDPYLAPECRTLHLKGQVFGHPNHKDGNNIRTSRIISVKGRKITTLSRTYLLGKIDPGYRKWLKENRPKWDWRKPITVKRV